MDNLATILPVISVYAGIVLFVLAILMPLVVLSARNGIHKNNKELKKLNENVEQLIHYTRIQLGLPIDEEGR